VFLHRRRIVTDGTHRLFELQCRDAEVLAPTLNRRLVSRVDSLARRTPTKLGPIIDGSGDIVFLINKNVGEKEKKVGKRRSPKLGKRVRF
jgi:hypothetical protein